MVRSDGTVTAKYRDYRAFGWMEDEDISLNQKYKYTGKPFDDEQMIEKMYYYGARYYIPLHKRFPTVDPLLGKNPSVSPYAYCLNNPLKFNDRDGREPDDPNRQRVMDLRGTPIEFQSKVEMAKTWLDDTFIQPAGDNVVLPSP